MLNFLKSLFDKTNDTQHEIPEKFKNCGNCKNAKWSHNYNCLGECKHCGTIASNGICNEFLPNQQIINHIKSLKLKEKNGYSHETNRPKKK